MVFYNEWDDFAAEWLRNLIATAELPQGTVDQRDVRSIRGADLAGYRQCHFFAGLGGWGYALRLAGWSPEREVWSASLPCQPFSSAGKRRGFEDERHLAPVFLRLVEERRPTTIFGEQVSSKAGRVWLADLRASLEALGYAMGGSDLCSAGVGALDIRQREYWVAYHEDLARPQAYSPALPVGKIRSTSVLDNRLRWTEMASPDWELSASWIVRDIDGVPSRVGGSRAFGNAINPILAAEFIRAAEEAV